ncbi:MAG TPA: TonB-dependent receptor [Vicinamibacterales bacterium]|nr:TonB-dependent receptor [Vicinamibacterales bacterium]
MRLASIRRLLVVCATLLIATSAGRAQETTGTILGGLTDQTGGVLPGVKVVITSVETGHARQVVTDGAGQYTASLPIGRYDISFVLREFQPFTARGISLHVNDRLQVNGRLTIGAIETMTVTAQHLVQPTSSVRHLIQPQAIQQLPIATRTFVQLVTLVPGVSSDLREEACFCDQGNLNISINGSRRSAVNWLLDGASNVNGWSNYTLVTTPSLDALKEVNVITSTYSAEWARNGGGVVNAVTKSGTNRFSGSAYYFLRNDALNANSFFRKLSARPEINGAAPRLRYGNFGYTLGGPALPARKKLFFFFSEEWRRSTRDRRTSAVQAVPDPAWLTDPRNSNYVPPEARDPNAVKLLALWPAANVPGTNRYEATIVNGFDTRQEFVRADYNVNTAWSVTGRYLRDQVDARGEYVTSPSLAAGHRYQVGHLGVAEVRRAQGRVVLESSYQLSRHRQVRKDRTYTRDSLGITSSEIFPENLTNAIPTITIVGVGSLGSQSPAGPREFLNHTVSANAGWQHGAHTLKAGGLIAVEHVDSNLDIRPTQGTFRFAAGGGFTAFQNFLRGNSGGACGNGCTYSETDIDVVNRFRSRRYEAYVQDNWRVHRQVTLDVGLRYAFAPPMTDAGDMLFTFLPSAYDRSQAPGFADPDALFVQIGTGNLFNGIRVAGRDSPFGRAIYPADRNNLQPRAGVAWDPTGGGALVVRAGYGVYFDQTQVGIFAQNVQSPGAFPADDPLSRSVFVSNAALSNPGREPIPPPFGVLIPQPYATSDSFVSPRWQHWNAGVQRRLYSRGAIDLGYVGGRGDHLVRHVDINQPQPSDQGGPANLVRPFRGYDSIYMRETTARSRYHGFLSSFRHDAGRAGAATANYTFSQNKADATYDNSEIDNPQNRFDKDAEFAPALTDRTHIFTASYVYALPLAGSGSAGWKRHVLHGWQIAGITRIESGPAVRLQAANCNFDGWCISGPLRPNAAGDAGAGNQDGLLWFDPAAFVPPAPREYGNAPVVPFRLPGRHQWDLALSKTFSLPGTSRLQFRADVINAFNRTQFLDVNTFCPGTTTCDPRSGFGQVMSARPPREIQLGLRLDW